MIAPLSASGLQTLQRTSQRPLAQSPVEQTLQEAQADERVQEAQQALQTVQGADESNGNRSLLDGELTEEEERIVQELQQVDQEVRAHEQAHKNVAGPYAGPIQYTTETGPDGREYAVGGSVQIDTSPIPGNPEATVRKLDIVIRAALAPAKPSSQDFAVARAAQAARQVAQRELQQQREEELAEARGENEDENATNPNQDDQNNSNSLNIEQQNNLNTLLNSINNTEQRGENTRGDLFDAIN